MLSGSMTPQFCIIHRTWIFIQSTSASVGTPSAAGPSMMPIAWFLAIPFTALSANVSAASAVTLP